MHIELRNIKHAAFASQETNCYEAFIYIDGQKAIHASNEGHGGSDHYRDLIPGSTQRVLEFCKTLPPVEYQGTKLDHTMEIFIGDLLENWLVEKQVKRRLAAHIFFTYKTKPGIFSIKAKYLTTLAAILRRKQPDIDKILNELPLAEAVKLLKA